MCNRFYVVIVSLALVGCGQIPTLRQSAPVSRGAGVVHQIAQQGDGSQWVTLTPPQPMGQTVGIAQGSDGKMWFTQDNLHSVVGKVDNYGKFVEYPVSAVPLQIIESGDGALWFVEIGPGTVGRITTPGKLTEFPIPFAGASPSGLTAGADGNIWVADNNIGAPKSIDKVTHGGAMTEYHLPQPNHRHSIFGITGGPNQNVWFTDMGTNEIGSVTPDGHFTIFAIPTSNSGAAGIALGADGNLYFAESQANKIGEIDRFGNITEYPVPSADKGPLYINEGYSGTTMWFDDQDAATGNRQFRQFNIATKRYSPPILPPYADSVPQYLYFGPDGNMWIADARGPILVAVTHVLTSTPASIVFSGVGQSQPIQIHETQYTQYKGGSFTARSSNSNIAIVVPMSVTPGNQTNTFVVTAQGVGSCSIHVRDKMGNSIGVPVTVQ